MNISVYHVNAFANRVFKGNPASVCVLSDWLPETTLQTIARENHLPATAFLVPKNDAFEIRWFTPEYEIDLCGHGTLASGYVIFNYLDWQDDYVNLHHTSGLLRVLRTSKELISLDFPVKAIEAIDTNDIIIQGLGASPKEIYQHKSERCLAVFESEEEVKKLNPDMKVLKQLAHKGIIATAASKEFDFISRTFYPRKMQSEDAITGSSHCLLIPYWSQKLDKLKLNAYQASHRGGPLYCELKNDRVHISGSAALYMQGSISLPG